MYERFFSLHGKPFDLTPDPAFYFPSAEHKKALAYLRYGLSKGEGFVLLTGVAGTGKSLVVQTLLKSLPTSGYTIGYVVFTRVAEQELLRMVAAALGLGGSGLSQADLIIHLESELKRKAQQGQRVLLVIDEVHNLDAETLETLRMLTNYQFNNRPCLQCFLVGQESFRATVSRADLPQLRQRVIAAHHLRTLQPDEIEGYVCHRLRCVGWKDDPGIDRDVYPLLFQYSQGVPRLVNNACDRLLLDAYLEEQHTITRASASRVVRELKGEVSQAERADTGVGASGGFVTREDLRNVILGSRSEAPGAETTMPAEEPDSGEAAEAESAAVSADGDGSDTAAFPATSAAKAPSAAPPDEPAEPRASAEEAETGFAARAAVRADGPATAGLRIASNSVEPPPLPEPRMPSAVPPQRVEPEAPADSDDAGGAAQWEPADEAVSAKLSAGSTSTEPRAGPEPSPPSAGAVEPLTPGSETARSVTAPRTVEDAVSPPPTSDVPVRREEWPEVESLEPGTEVDVDTEIRRLAGEVFDPDVASRSDSDAAAEEELVALESGRVGVPRRRRRAALWLLLLAVVVAGVYGTRGHWEDRAAPVIAEARGLLDAARLKLQALGARIATDHEAAVSSDRNEGAASPPVTAVAERAATADETGVSVAVNAVGPRLQTGERSDPGGGSAYGQAAQPPESADPEGVVAAATVTGGESADASLPAAALRETPADVPVPSLALAAPAEPSETVVEPGPVAEIHAEPAIDSGREDLAAATASTTAMSTPGPSPGTDTPSAAAQAPGAPSESGAVGLGMQSDSEFLLPQVDVSQAVVPSTTQDAGPSNATDERSGETQDPARSGGDSVTAAIDGDEGSDQATTDPEVAAAKAGSTVTGTPKAASADDAPALGVELQQSAPSESSAPAGATTAGAERLAKPRLTARRSQEFGDRDTGYVILPPESAAASGDAGTFAQTAPTDADVVRLIATYTQAYRDADLEAVKGLLSKDCRYNGQPCSASYLENLRRVFRLSSERSIEFRNMQWVYTQRRAEGIGRLAVEYASSQDDTVVREQSEVVLTLVREASRTRISRFTMNSRVKVRVTRREQGG